MWCVRFNVFPFDIVESSQTNSYTRWYRQWCCRSTATTDYCFVGWTKYRSVRQFGQWKWTKFDTNSNCFGRCNESSARRSFATSSSTASTTTCNTTSSDGNRTSSSATSNTTATNATIEINWKDNKMHHMRWSGHTKSKTKRTKIDSMRKLHQQWHQFDDDESTDANFCCARWWCQVWNGR